MRIGAGFDRVVDAVVVRIKIDAIVEAVTVGVHVFQAVGYAVVVTVGIERIRPVGVFLAVRHAVTVAVARRDRVIGHAGINKQIVGRVARRGVGHVGQYFGAIINAAVIRIGVQRIGLTNATERSDTVALVAIKQSVAVGIGIGRIGFAAAARAAQANRVDGRAVAIGILDTVLKTVIVAVRIRGIGGCRRIAVGHKAACLRAAERCTVTVAAAARQRLSHAALQTVGKAVTIGIGQHRAGLVTAVGQTIRPQSLVAVGDAVVVRIAIKRIAVTRIKAPVIAKLVGVFDAIIVAVAVGRIGTKADFHTIGNTVAVAVRATVVGTVARGRIGAVDQHLGAVLGAAIIAINVQRIRHSEGRQRPAAVALIAIEQAVFIGVGIVGIGLAGT